MSAVLTETLGAETVQQRDAASLRALLVATMTHGAWVADEGQNTVRYTILPFLEYVDGGSMYPAVLIRGG